MHQQLAELSEDHSLKAETVEKQAKIRESETNKMNEMRNEYTKLVFILRRIKKNYDDLKALLKIVEKEKLQVRLENEQLVSNANNLRQTLDESAAEKMKVYSDNQKLKSSLNLLKYYDSARQADQRTMAERLQKSEIQIRALLEEKSKNSENPPPPREYISAKSGSCNCGQLGKLMNRKMPATRTSSEDKDGLLSKLFSEFEDTMHRKTGHPRKSRFNKNPRKTEYRGEREERVGDAFSGSTSSLDSLVEKSSESPPFNKNTCSSKKMCMRNGELQNNRNNRNSSLRNISSPSDSNYDLRNDLLRIL